MLLYVPVNRLVSGGFNLVMPLDSFIPVVPIFVSPYLFGILFWASTIVFVNLKMNFKIAKRFNIMMILAGILSVLIYIVIPTFVSRPEIVGNDVFSNILRLIYSNDYAYNAAPSGHTFNTILCFLVLYKFVPKHRTIWSIISFLIIVSTVFTKQHNAMDVLIGIVFAIGVYILCGRFSGLKPHK